jgi:hypothetical protein
MAASKLSIYQGALSILGERKLASLTENVEARYKLDDAWDNDFVDRVLQMGQWNFATRTVELQASTSTTPSFGYQYAFDKPTDHKRTVGVASDEFFTNPLTSYSDEAQWWFADIETIYAKYVSNDSQFGGDYSLWPPNFTKMAESFLAMEVAPRLTGLSVNDATLMQKWKIWLREAKASDAMESPAQFAPTGSWARARGSQGSGQRGKRNQLIG